MGGMGFRLKWRNQSWKRGGKDEKRLKGWGANFIGLVLGSRAAALFFDGFYFSYKAGARSSTLGGR